MTKSSDPWVVVQMMCKESLEAIRGQLSGPRSDGSYVALGSQGGGDGSAELPVDENGATASSLRARGYGAGWSTKGAARRLFMFLLPSFVARALGHVDEDAEIPAVTATSYLNGLRGLAALFVTFAHNTDDYQWVYHGWGQTPEDYYLVQLPFVRDVFCGVFMVAIFFVVSGFALTYSPLRKCHAGQSADAIALHPVQHIPPPVRLFMPVVPTLLATTIAIQNGVYYSSPMRTPSGPMVSGAWSYVPFIWGTLVTIMTNPTTGTILPPGWTLSTEYQGSLLVFMCCLVFARTSAPVRIFCVLALLAFLLQLSLWHYCLFLAGMILGDIRHVRKKLPALEGRARRAVNAATWLLLAVSLFLGGWPMRDDGYAAAGYSWFTWAPTFGIEPMRYFPSVGAVGLVAALENLPVIQRGLTSRCILYLGEISYGVYLVHWLVGRSSATWGLRYRMLESGYSLGFSWTLTFVIMLVLSIWVGDINWRLFDQKSVRFSHWLSKKFGI